MPSIATRLRIVAASLAAIVLLSTSRAAEIKTTYGEDPVPDTHRSLEPPYTAYGMDPIPVKSPLERWLEFREYRAARLRERELRYPDYQPRWGWWHRGR